LALEGHLKLLKTKQDFIDKFESKVSLRKLWLDYVIADTQGIINEMLEKIKGEIY
jgi:hypothetical protein